MNRCLPIKNVMTAVLKEGLTFVHIINHGNLTPIKNKLIMQKSLLNDHFHISPIDKTWLPQWHRPAGVLILFAVHEGAGLQLAAHHGGAVEAHGGVAGTTIHFGVPVDPGD